MTASTRESRTQQSRAAEPLHENYNDNWESPALLDTKNIPARPGFVQRWVRTKLRAADDQNNIFKKINQGWQVRTMDSVPKGQFVPNIDFNGTSVIGIHGMILMERPAEMHERHGAYNRSQAQNQLTAVKENMFNVHKDGTGLTRPTMKNKSNVSQGRLVEADDD